LCVLGVLMRVDVLIIVGGRGVVILVGRYRWWGVG